MHLPAKELIDFFSQLYTWKCTRLWDFNFYCYHRFHMEGDRLYSVKWYRNEQEFFRYVPNDRPEHQIFPQHGIRVEVSWCLDTEIIFIQNILQRNRSKRQEVTLIDLQLEASGTYRQVQWVDKKIFWWKLFQVWSECGGSQLQNKACWGKQLKDHQ